MTDETNLRDYFVYIKLGAGQMARRTIKAEEVVVERATLSFKVAGKSVAQMPGRHVLLWVETEYEA